MKMYVFVLIGQISGTVFWKRKAKSSYKSFQNIYRSRTSMAARYVPHLLFRRLSCFVADEWEGSIRFCVWFKCYRIICQHSLLAISHDGTSVTDTEQKLQNNCWSDRYGYLHSTMEASRKTHENIYWW